MTNDIQIFYFANLADKLDCENEFFSLSEAPITLAQLKEQLAERGAVWQETLNTTSTRCAVNQAIASEDALLSSGDEVAFFPPVTGG